MTEDSSHGPFANRVFHLLEYSHLDWAWTFSRDFHRQRYALIFDEALTLAERDPEFRFFVDSYTESLREYFADRPDRISRWRKLVNEGRIALVGGHYANLRPATAPEETYIRNLELGRRMFQRLFPDWEPAGFANMDTAIGHSQLPHVLSLAGLTYYLTGRPELGLERDGVPKLFRWQGQGGGEVITCVQHYGILLGALMELGRGEEHLATGVAHFRELMHGFENHSARNLPAFYSADDMRFRRHHVTDEPLDLPRAREALVQAFGAEVVHSTPDLLMKALGEDNLPSLSGPVDHGDVSYNGPFGSGALQALRDEAASRLVEAEIYLALSGCQASWPNEELEQLWCEALTAQSHAEQFLFEEDLEDMRLRLQKVIPAACELRRRACATRVDAKATSPNHKAVVVHSSVPQTRNALATVHVLATDFCVRGYELQDETGDPVPQQVCTPQNPSRPGEWDILAQLDVPGCGVRTLRLAPASPASFPQALDLPLDGETQAGSALLRWERGLLAGVSVGGCEHVSDTVSFLEPVRCPITVRGWMTTALLPAEEPYVVETLRQLEFGPLRWRFRRRGRIGPHIVVQTLDVHVNGRIDYRTELHAGPDNCLFVLRTPCEADCALRVSIPFGVETRDLASVHDHAGETGNRVIERQVPSVFYARDWAQFTVGEHACALVARHGDRYWRRPGNAPWLEHHLMRVTEPYDQGWEQHAAMDRPGFCRSEHTLVFAEAAESAAELSRIADEARFPVRTMVVDADTALETRVWLRTDARNVRLLACRRIGDELEIRLVESEGRAGQVALEFEGPVSEARLTDLRWRSLDETVTVEANCILVPTAPWQIRNLRIRLR